jgi:hypothetical protein
MDWNRIPTQEEIDRTMTGMQERNFNPVILPDSKSALEKLGEMIPAGASVMTGSSTTLQQIGFTDLLIGGNHPWRNYKEIILNEKDRAKQADLRRESTTAGYFLGSLQAITTFGQALGTDNTGSRQGGYVFSAAHVIWVVGVNKIVPDIATALRRLYEHVFPLEDERMKKSGAPGTSIGKMVVYEREVLPQRIFTVLIRESLGF